MIVTHCGSAIVRGDERQATEKLRRLGERLGVAIEIAWDGLERVIR
jgi:hypothetical protein